MQGDPPRNSPLTRRSVLRLAGATLAVPATLETGAVGRAAGASAEDPPDPLWNRRIGGERPDIATAGGAMVAQDGEALLALDPRTGDARWTAERVTSGGGFLHAPEDTVYAVDDGEVTAVAADDGTVRWTVDVGWRVSSITVHDGQVILGNSSGSWRALDAGSGTEAAAGSLGDYVVFVAGVADGTAYLTAPGEAVAAVSLEDGSERWRRKGEYGWGSLHDGSLYLGGAGETMLAVDPATGETEWTFQGESYQGGNVVPWPTEEALFALASGHIFRVDPSDGTEQWSYSERALYLPVPEHIEDDTVYTSIGGTVIALDVADGTERWTDYTGAYEVSMTEANGTVYAGGAGQLHAYGLDGAARWTADIEGPSANRDTPKLAQTGPSLGVLNGTYLRAYSVDDPPDPAIAITSGPPQAGDAVAFSGEATEDRADERSALSFEWSFGDGTTGSGMTVEHTYDAAGTYEVELAVSDTAGNTATETRSVSVAPAPSPTPTATPSPTETPSEGVSMPGFGSSAAAAALAAVAGWLVRRRGQD